MSEKAFIIPIQKPEVIKQRAFELYSLRFYAYGNRILCAGDNLLSP